MTTVAKAKAICQAQPGATHDIKWGSDLVYSVGERMFAVIGPSGSMSFKVDDHRFLELTDREGFLPAPYLARAKWVLVQDLKTVKDAELQELVSRSYAIIRAKLTKKQQAALG